MKILLFGATGNLGKSITEELKDRGLNFSIAVRDVEKIKIPLFSNVDYKIADVTKPSTIVDICKGFDIVISALGKSVSINDNCNASYSDIDYKGNLLILEDALRHKIKKIVYISALGAEKHQHLDYFKAHHEVTLKIVTSGINYSIIKPPAIFSAFLDLIPLARKGQLVNIGTGSSKTNPIYEGDLAKIIVESISLSNVFIEAGGKKIYSRYEINKIIQNTVDKTKKIKQFPGFIFKLILPILKITNRSVYHKFAFFLEVINNDAIAPMIGNTNLESYIRSKVQAQNRKCQD